MKNKFTKVLVLIMAVASILCMAIAITASANEAEIKPEIISKNMMYSDKYSVMYAVAAESVAEGPVTINVYREYPTSESTPVGEYVATQPQDEQIGGETRSVYVFTGFGVGAQDFADKIYAQATDKAGNKSDVVEYSVVEYFLERLYGGYDISPDQTELYNTGLAFGAAAQKIYAKNDAIKVNDYKYVRVVGGTVNGVTKGMFIKGETVTLSENAKGWAATIIVDGEAIVEEIEGNEYTVENHVTIATNVKLDLPYSYYDTQKSLGDKVIDYDNSYDELNATNENAVLPVITKHNYMNAYKSGSLYVEISDSIATLGNRGASARSPELGFYNVNAKDKNCVVFETDIMFKAESSDSLTNTSQWFANIGFSSAYQYSPYSQSQNEKNMLYKSQVIGSFNPDTDEWGELKFYDITIESGKWYNFVMEYYKAEGVIKYYVDGYLVSTIETTANFECNNAVVQLVGQCGKDSTISFDNTYFGTVDKALEE